MAYDKTIWDENTDVTPARLQNIEDGIEAAHDEITSHKADYEYQTPTIVGTQIQLEKQSDTAILKFRLDADLTGGAITISYDSGATSKPLIDIDNEPVTELNKGFVEVVENAVNFTYAPKGGRDSGVVRIYDRGTFVSNAEILTSIKSYPQYPSTLNFNSDHIYMYAEGNHASGTSYHVAFCIDETIDFTDAELMLIDFDMYKLLNQQDNPVVVCIMPHNQLSEDYGNLPTDAISTHSVEFKRSLTVTSKTHLGYVFSVKHLNGHYYIHFITRTAHSLVKEHSINKIMLLKEDL